MELFIKSESFRQALNEAAHSFHEDLVRCLREFFARDKSVEGHANDGKYLELLLDLILVYYYFNRRVSNLYLGCFSVMVNWFE